MATQLTHLAMHVSDVDACIDFYTCYCEMRPVHERVRDGRRIVWLASAGREDDFVIVLLPGGTVTSQAANDYSHLGFAMASKREVDEIAARARNDGILLWEPVQEPPPVGYYCGVRDPEGKAVEFSYGQPLGPGAPSDPDVDRPEPFDGS